MNILLTGSAGFVGTHLRRELEKAGHEVIGIDVKKTMAKDILCDLSDFPLLKEILSAHRPDGIIHLAAISRVAFSNYSLLYETNIGGTINLLSAITSVDLKTSFLFVSSAQVYGSFDSSQKGLIDETVAIAPVNHYGASKASCEHIVSAFCMENEIPYVIARPFNHTGKGQTVDFVIPKIVEAFVIKQESLKLGNIDVVREFLDVRDVVYAYRLMIENSKKLSGNIFNVSSGIGYSIREILLMLETLTGHKPRIDIEPSLLRKNEIKSIVGSYERLKSQTDWRPIHKIEETLRWMLGL